MGEIYDFLEEEYRSAYDLQEKLKQDNHEIDIQLEVIQQTIKKITETKDSTSFVFSSAATLEGFDGKETDYLKSKYELLCERKKENIVQITEFENKVKKMKHLLHITSEAMKNCNDKNKKSYNSYEVFYLQEMDRQRIARDIHDSVVQSLTVLIHKNEFIDKVMETDKQRAHLELKKNNEIIKSGIEELRNIIYDLRPMAFDDLGFEKSFYAAMERIKSGSSMIVNANYRCKNEKIDSVIAISALRIMEELCSNSMKHSGGTKITIDVYDSEDQLKIDYADDGKGYCLEQECKISQKKTGFGLAILKERVVLLGGNINAFYNEKDGMCYHITLPLHMKSEKVGD